MVLPLIHRVPYMISASASALATSAQGPYSNQAPHQTY